MPAILAHSPNTPQRIDFPSPDQVPEIDQDPAVPPRIIEEPVPSRPIPDEGDIDNDPGQIPHTDREPDPRMQGNQSLL